MRLSRTGHAPLILAMVMALAAGRQVSPGVPDAPATQPADRVAWDLDSAPADWVPVEKTIALETVATGTANPASKGCLQVNGTIKGGWNYVQSPSRPMRPGQLYRLTSWLRVDRMG